MNIGIWITIIPKQPNQKLEGLWDIFRWNKIGTATINDWGQYTENVTVPNNKIQRWGKPYCRRNKCQLLK